MDPSSLSLSHVKVNDYEFAYRKTGNSANNPPLLLFHGHISDLRSWTAIEPLLADKFTVYAVSRRWAWPNQPVPDDVSPTWEQDAQDIIELIEALDISPCHALGNSSGAFMLAWAAKTHPHLFRTLLLEEPPMIPLFYPTLPPGLWDTLKFLVTHPISFFPVTYYGATTVGPAMECAKKYNDPERTLALFGPGVLGPKFWKKANDDSQRKQQLHDNAKWLNNWFASGMIPAYLPEEARRLNVPTLVLTGTDGPMSQHCIDAELFRLLGSQRKDRVWIEGAGHLVHEDEPVKVAEAVERFIFD